MNASCPIKIIRALARRGPSTYRSRSFAAALSHPCAADRTAAIVTTKTDVQGLLERTLGAVLANLATIDVLTVVENAVVAFYNLQPHVLAV
jgi:hypothetical protein